MVKKGIKSVFVVIEWPPRRSQAAYIKTHFSVSLAPQCPSQVVVCVSTLKMYPRSRYFLVYIIFQFDMKWFEKNDCIVKRFCYFCCQDVVFSPMWAEIKSPGDRSEHRVLVRIVGTCGFWANLTLTKRNKVGNAFFWNSFLMWRQNEHQKNISSLDFRTTSWHAQPILPWWVGSAMHAS